MTHPGLVVSPSLGGQEMFDALLRQATIAEPVARPRAPGPRPLRLKVEDFTDLSAGRGERGSKATTGDNADEPLRANDSGTGLASATAAVGSSSDGRAASSYANVFPNDDADEPAANANTSVTSALSITDVMRDLGFLDEGVVDSEATRIDDSSATSATEGERHERESAPPIVDSTTLFDYVKPTLGFYEGPFQTEFFKLRLPIMRRLSEAVIRVILMESGRLPVDLDDDASDTAVEGGDGSVEDAQ
ncbi:hypothetical protein HDZ31DRAFT_76249 [Schizophyllum fasciatum]